MNNQALEQEINYASSRLCDAIAALRSGQAGKCAAILDHVAVLLPNVGRMEQDEAKARRAAAGVGFEAQKGRARC